MLIVDHIKRHYLKSVSPTHFKSCFNLHHFANECFKSPYMIIALCWEVQLVLKVCEGHFIQRAEVFYLWSIVWKRVRSIPPTAPQLLRVSEKPCLQCMLYGTTVIHRYYKWSYSKRFHQMLHCFEPSGHLDFKSNPQYRAPYNQT